MRIKVIIPNSGMSSETLREREKMLSAYAWPGTEISVDCIDKGPESIESSYDEVLACPYILEKALQAQEEGYEALIIYCGSDPAVGALREILDIPVIGPGKVSKLIASDLGYRFSVLTVLDSCIVRDREAVYEKGFESEKLASVRSIGIPVSALRNDLEEAFEALRQAGEKCLADGADCLVLSCLGMAGLGERLQEALGVPVLDPAGLAVQYAQLLVKLGLAQSRIAYPRPPEKTRI